ncbi:hypothetical protein [Bradyrhizobium arachidis]|uniref:hypothetical protein n=1 Tax=Bradyrhizobium arachidis TaxID=858423 RepID=UPI00116048BC|nr:hypothetical protein [Bradyrhizobium arachidis]
MTLVLRNLDQHIGRLAERYVQINWWGETPEVIEPEEQHIIDLLNEYDAALKHDNGREGCVGDTPAQADPLKPH